MKNISNQTGHLQLQKISACFVLAIFLALSISSAHADNRHDGRGDDGRAWQRHQEQANGYWRRHHYRPEPRYVYAPPVVYEPPTVVESPGINLFIPLSIR